MPSDTIFLIIFTTTVLAAIVIKLKLKNEVYVDIIIGLGALTMALTAHLSNESRIPPSIWALSGIIALGSAYLKYQSHKK